MLDRLVRRAIFAEPDRVVGHHIDDAFARECGEADRRTAIIGEYEKRAGIGNDAAVQRHTVHRRCHAVLAHAVVDEAPRIVRSREHRHALRLGVVGASQVGRAADHLRHRHGQRFERSLRRGAGGNFFRRGGNVIPGVKVHDVSPIRDDKAAKTPLILEHVSE